MIKKIFFTCLTSIFLCITAFGQGERIIPLHSNPVIRKYLKDHPKPATAGGYKITVTSDTVQLPFIDDFSYDGIYPNQNLWSDSNVYINRDFPINPPTIGVATFDGLNKYGLPYSANSYDSIADHLTSRYINLNYAGDTTIWLSFFYEPKGHSKYQPYSQDSLMVEFENPADSSWDIVWSIPGNNSDSTNAPVFTQVMINIRDSVYLNPGFRFRFTNIANLAQAEDQWNVDYVRLERGRSATDTGFTTEGAFLYRNRSLLVYPYTSMPYSHFKTNPTQFVVNSDTVVYKNLTGASYNFANDFRITIDTSDTSYIYYDSGVNSISVNPYSDTTNIKPLTFGTLPIWNMSSLEFTTWNINETHDINPQNDTVRETQVLSNYYSYDDGTAEEGYGVYPANENGEGEVALQFNLKMQDTLRGVAIYWDPVWFNDINPVSQLINVAVWNSISLNTDGENLLYQLVDVFPTNDSTFSDTAFDTFYTYIFDTVLVVQGTIYVGWIQIAEQTEMGVGFDVNTDSHNLLYYNSGLGWTQSGQIGSVMIRPIFGSAINVGVNNIPKPNFTATVFPNPASGVINVSIHAKQPSSYSFQLFDAIGKLVAQQKETAIDVSKLQDGFYLLKITDDKTCQFETHKIVVRH